ncbi:MAG: stage II sporulation protein P, partial [Oscillospiraceae bacterium]
DTTLANSSYDGTPKILPPPVESAKLPLEYYNGENDIIPIEIELPFKDYESPPEIPPMPTAPRANPFVPLKFRKPLEERDLSYKNNKNFLSTHGIMVKNATKYSDKEIAEILQTPNAYKTERGLPSVLIYHTHATESFNPYDGDFYDSRYNWRSRDNNSNMVSVGAAASAVLEKHGFVVLHDTSQHDYPSYNGSYKNSFNSVSRYLAENPTLKIVLDLHRDATEQDDGKIIKPTIKIGELKYAQLMIIANCDDGSGLIPNWRENFKLAAAIQEKVNEIAPNIARPILLSYRKYNQQLSKGSLLIEIGSHGSTLEEAQRTAEILGKALAEILKEG